MLFLSIITLIAGFILLIKGADWLVDGASGIAKRLGVSELVIGLTIVSFGTSAPELLVNVIASLQSNSNLVIGNIVGSNLANTLLIIGATAVYAPLVVQRSTVFKEIPFCLLAAVTLLITANDALLDGKFYSALDRTDGLTFLGYFLIFLYYTFGIRHAKKHHAVGTKKIPMYKTALLIVGGCLGLGVGGHFTVEAATDLARILGIGDALIGLTLVALGTSLPELVTSLIAAKKGNADIAVGNVIGSNIFNIFWILGISATIRPIMFEPYLNTDVITMILSTVFVFIFVHTGRVQYAWFRRLFNKHTYEHVISRREGTFLLIGYAAYIVYIGWRG